MTDAGCWQIASGLFFAGTGAIALIRRRTSREGLYAAGIAGAGLAATAVSVLLPRITWLHEWILPPILLLLAYWGSGGLFVAPMPRVEAGLMWIDRALGITRVRLPRLLAEVLESAYVSVYPVVGLAFVLHLTVTPSPSADRFWSVVLITDFICFGMLPWVQTRPPRALERKDPWVSSVRRFNLRLLGATSIHVNTFPSGHTAEALAAALLLLGAPLPIVVAFFVAAAAISAGAVLGRYHYAADAVAGWGVALLVWWLARMAG
jgi:membrane-associated phospholipid phosphatase